MRVLFVTHNVPRFTGDAAGSFVLRLAVALQSAGAIVDIIAPGAPGLSERDVLEGVSIRRVRYASDARMTLAYTGNMAEDVRGSWSGRAALLQLLVALRRATRDALDAAHRAGTPYTIIHAHWWLPAALALWGLRRRHDPPLVITMHGSDVRLAARTRSAHPIMRAVLDGAAIRTAVSQWLADTASRIAPDGAIHVSPMPVDTRHFDLPTPEQGGALADNVREPRVLFVGRLNGQKGLADLLRALARPELDGVALDVVGEGSEGDSLRAAAKQSGIDVRITWHGALTQPALVPMYQHAALVAVPSREEGLGLVAVEAQLCGTPVVAYAEGGLLDVVRPQAGGTLVPPGDHIALAVAIAGLLRDPVEAHRAGEVARADMRARFAPTAVAARYLAHYREASA